MVMMMVMMVAIILMMGPLVTCLTCPSSCSPSISPVPYPFGAAPGCGAPGFQISNCSINPQWNLQLAGTTYIFYVRSINPNLNSSSPSPSPYPSYGYGGSIMLSILPPSTLTPPLCQVNDPVYSYNSFSDLNLFIFQEANLTFYQDRYLLLNCTSSSLSPPSGVLIPSSSSCNKFLSNCSLHTSSSCLEYTPDKELALGALLNNYNCTSFRRFLIALEDDPISTWVTATQFAWGPVNDAASCSSCQGTGGTCGYNTQDNSFLCYCGNETYQTDCGQKSGRIAAKQIVVGVFCAVAFCLILAVIAFYCRRKYYHCRVFRHYKSLKLDSINQAPIEFPYGALEAATKSFSTKIGQGAFGKVYKGLVSDGTGPGFFCVPW